MSFWRSKEARCATFTLGHKQTASGRHPGVLVGCCQGGCPCAERTSAARHERLCLDGRALGHAAAVVICAVAANKAPCPLNTRRRRNNPARSGVGAKRPGARPAFLRDDVHPAGNFARDSLPSLPGGLAGVDFPPPVRSLRSKGDCAALAASDCFPGWFGGKLRFFPLSFIFPFSLYIEARQMGPKAGGTGT